MSGRREPSRLERRNGIGHQVGVGPHRTPVRVVVQDELLVPGCTEERVGEVSGDPIDQLVAVTPKKSWTVAGKPTATLLTLMGTLKLFNLTASHFRMGKWLSISFNFSPTFVFDSLPSRPGS